MTVLYIDDNEEAIRLFSRNLSRIIGENEDVSLQSITPEKNIGGMIKRITEYSDLVTVILDEKLNESGYADYTGMELADKLRNIYPKLPIYILTNYVDAALSEKDLEQNVEYILDKSKISDSNYSNKISARMRRHIDIYNDISTGRNKRFQELLRKSISVSLTDKEKKKYEELDL